MGNGIQRLCFDVVEIETIVRVIINFSYNSHIVSPDDVQSQNDLFHALRRAVHSLVTLVQDQVDGLVKTFQCGSSVTSVSSTACFCSKTEHFNIT